MAQSTFFPPEADISVKKMTAYSNRIQFDRNKVQTS